MLSDAEISILRDIASRENTSVANIIRNAMNVVFFSAHPDLAKTAVAENVDRFFNDLTDKLPLSPRFNAKRTAIKKKLVQDLVNELNLMK